MLDRLIDGEHIGLVILPVVIGICILVSSRLKSSSRFELRRLTLYASLFVVLEGAAYLLRLGGWADFPVRLAAVFFLLAAAARLLLAGALGIGRSVFGWQPQKIYGDIATVAVYIVIIGMLLSRAGIHSSDLFTGSAIITGVLALSLKETFGNMLAGVAIHLQQPFTIGDWIQYDDKREHVGKVKEINWRATTIETLDLADIVIPNGRLSENPIYNFARPFSIARRSIYFTCSYREAPTEVQRIVLDAILGSPGVCESPAPSIVTNGFTDRGIEYWVRYFISELQRRDVIDGGVRDRVWYALDRHGIAMTNQVNELRLVRDQRAADRAADEAELRRVFAASPLFKSLPPGAVDHLASRAAHQTYIHGETIVREGANSSDLYFLIEGEASAARHSEAGGVELGRIRPGDFFGERSLLLGEPRSATISAVGRCELAVLHKEDMQKIVTQYPDVAALLAKTLAERELEARQRLSDVSIPKTDDDEQGLLTRIRRFLLGDV